MSIWQTKSWQEMLQKSWQVEKSIYLKNIFIEKRKVSLWEFWLFTLWVDYKDIPKDFLDEIKNLCKVENALFFQIETLDYKHFEEKDLDWFEKKYYKKFITPFTAIIDLEKSEDEILADMKQKWRYNIRLAEKKWVKIMEAEKTEKNIKIFYDLMMETTSRDNFFWNTFDYYKIFLDELPYSKLLFAYFEGKIISAWIFVFLENEAIYYYWASTSEKQYRNLMAPYLLQWKAIQIAKEKWIKIYDFLWTAWETEKNSPLAWVTDFKLKFTKQSQKVSESFLFINKKFKYKFIKFLKKLKK